LSQKAPLNFLYNSAKTGPILIIFGSKNPEEISHHKIVNAPTPPE